MKCKDIQLVLLEQENESLPQDVQAHRESCEECRNFLSASQILVEANSISAPSESIDKAILASAREMTDKQEAARTIMFPFMVFQRIAIAAAAILVCSFIALHLNKQNDAPVQVVSIDTSDEQPIIEMLSIADMELTAVEEGIEIESEYEAAALADTTTWAESFDEEIMQLQCEAYFEEELLRRNEAETTGGNAKQNTFSAIIKAV